MATNLFKTVDYEVPKGTPDRIVRSILSPDSISISVYDGDKLSAIVSYLGETRSLSYLRVDYTTSDFRLARICKKLLEVLPEDVCAWVSSEDRRAIRFVEFLDMVVIDHESGYSLYKRQVW